MNYKGRVLFLLGIIAALLIWLWCLLLDGNKDLKKISEFMNNIEYVEIID